MNKIESKDNSLIKDIKKLSKKNIGLKKQNFL